MNATQHSTFLTRAQYDALLPMSWAKLRVYLRAERSWSIEGVRVTFRTLADAREFESES